MWGQAGKGKETAGSILHRIFGYFLSVKSTSPKGKEI